MPDDNKELETQEREREAMFHQRLQRDWMQ
jgi:hypothetical protein